MTVTEVVREYARIKREKWAVWLSIAKAVLFLVAVVVAAAAVVTAALWLPPAVEFVASFFLDGESARLAGSLTLGFIMLSFSAYAFWAYSDLAEAYRRTNDQDNGQ